MNDIHELNRAWWNALADDWRRMADDRGAWRECHRNPALIFSPSELSVLHDVADKPVCVLGSGDNEAVFALAGLGARVTSVDISERQLAVAKERAEILGLPIRFVRADVTDLATLADGEFDVVYTGGHVSVWVADLKRFYAEAGRIIRPGGLFIINEYHPIRRMWNDSTSPAPHARYFNRGPYEYRSDEGLPQFEFHWTVTDHIQPVLDAGCTLLRAEEFGEGIESDNYEHWMPRSLPLCLLLVARKADA